MDLTKADDKTIEMLATAYLFREGKSQKDISNALGIVPVRVTRNLKKARKRILVEEVEFRRGTVSRSLMRTVLQRVNQQNLENQLNKTASADGQSREVWLRVFHCGECSDDAERMTRLGALAAPTIRRLLLRSKSCGLTWGGMLKRVVTGLSDLPFPQPWARKAIPCIPLCGEPLGRERASFSSSVLARDLGVILNGDQYDAPSLAMVPAFVPDAFTRYEKDGVWKLIDFVKSYAAIFGPHVKGNATEAKRATPLALNLDMILTSVGAQTKPLGFGRGVLFDEMSVSYEDLKSLIVAEVGGVCIQRPGLSPEKVKQFETVQTSWTGLCLEHLATCANRGGDPLYGPPGVVVVSGGKGKAPAIRQLIKLGLINYLIIDDVVAKELG